MVNVLLFTDNHFDTVFIRGAGTYRIATEIRKAGYTCQVIDFFGFMTQNDIQKIIDKYVGKETLVIGFGSTFITSSIDDDYKNDTAIEKFLKDRQNLHPKLNYNELYGVKYPYSNDIIDKIINLCLQKNPNIKFIYGGIEAKYKHSYHIDCYFTNNNGDRDIVDYLNKLSKNEQLPIEYNISNITAFDFMEAQILWHESDFIFNNEVLPIEISRGCIFNCTYCNLPIRGKNKLDNIRDSEKLKEEFIRNYELNNITSYFFCDSTLNDSTFKLEKLYNEVISKLPFKIQFSSYLRLDLINAHREQIDLLKEMGLKFAVFGIGTLNIDALKLIRKTFPHDKMENMMNILKERWGDSILTTGSFIYGLPGETRKSLDELENWLLNDSLEYFDYVDVYPLRLSLNETVKPELKSIMSIHFEKYGFNKDENQNLKNYNWIRKDDELDYLKANKKCEEILLKLHNDDRCKYANINAIGIYNLGMSFDKLKNNNYNNIVLDKNLSNIYITKITEYKNNIL